MQPLAVAILAFALGACAQRGDFGRPAPSVWNTAVDATGSLAAQERGEPASDFPLTDEESVLRARAWRFLMPAQAETAFEDARANLARARVLPPVPYPTDVARYHDGLVGEAFRSPASRYRRLSDDAAADGRLIAPFVEIATRVAAADAERLRALNASARIAAPERRDALERVAENLCLIARVRASAHARSAAYRYALDHLVIAMPAREAVPAERVVVFLEARIGLLDGLLQSATPAACDGTPAPTTAPLIAKF